MTGRLTVVVGGQYGSEGKGKLVSHLAGAGAPVAVVRCGGPNAGHTADDGEGRRAVLRQLPSGAVYPDCGLMLAAGMQIDVDLLLEEAGALGVDERRLTVDPGAVLIEERDAKAEVRSGLGQRIGSTQTGTGAAIARKVMRGQGVRRATDDPRLAPFLGDVAGVLSDLLLAGTHVVVEGSQGAGLSLHHGSWPHVTGRDTTAAAFLSEAGLPPRAVTDVAVVLRTYPIRVAGSSGPLNEIGWDEVARRSNAPVKLEERTTVTRRLRRIGEFDWALAKRAVLLNGPSALAVHGLDYLDRRDLGCRKERRLSRASRGFVDALEDRLNTRVRWLFTGPSGADLIDRDAAAVSGAHDIRLAVVK